jgi:hypothetical protein
MKTTRPERLDAATRAKALEAGWWQKHDGEFVHLRRMPDPHLVNAWLQALEAGEALAITSRLAAEVVRRKLETYAADVAMERMQR